MTTHSEKIGAEIVNCITLWSPREDLSERVYKVPVAVVSNNDCTVSILNVATSDTLETLKLPDFVNRSAISPDGELLVAICDDPFLYIHKRLPKAEPRRERFENKRSPIYEWVLAGRIQLESQRQADRSQMRGSFALSFSRSGKYLAVATQYGIISIFDAECLTETQSLMVSFTTSRPGRQAGAVRAMEFSPGPFDLLVSLNLLLRCNVSCDDSKRDFASDAPTYSSHFKIMKLTPIGLDRVKWPSRHC